VSRATFRLIPLAAIAWALHCASATAQDNRLGRLFFTPAERERLDLRRGAPTDASAPQTMTVNGVIVRPGKSPILFLDGKEVRNGEGPAGVSLAPQMNQSIRIQAEGGPVVSARPGQIVDLTNGRTTENYQLTPQTLPAVETDSLPASEPGRSTTKSVSRARSNSGAATKAVER
jgi:hypothetical protein